MKRSLLYQVGGTEGIELETFVREVELAEELGVDTVWCFPASDEDGRFSGTAPEIWIAALAARTGRVRLGWGIPDLLPPSRPPFRVAEQAASLDLAAEGRLEVAFLPEGALSGDADGRDWEEGVRMLIDMWDAPRFSWTSERFTVRPVDVVPKPVQDPHPACWLAGWNDDHAKAAGRGGFAFLDVSGVGDEGIEIHRDAYRAGRAEAEPEELVSVENFGALADLEDASAAAERIEAWAGLGLDHAILRAGPMTGGHDETLRRIRTFSGAEDGVH